MPISSQEIFSEDFCNESIINRLKVCNNKGNPGKTSSKILMSLFNDIDIRRKSLGF